MLKLGLIIGFCTHLVLGYPNPIRYDHCMTTPDSDDPDKECIFPFIHDNVTMVAL